MSIYAVKLNEWYPIGDTNYIGDVISSYRCLACGSKIRYSKAWGHHSVPFGCGDTWCTEKCFHSGRVARPDKRRLRRLKRQWKKYGWTK